MKYDYLNWKKKAPSNVSVQVSKILSLLVFTKSEKQSTLDQYFDKIIGPNVYIFLFFNRLIFSLQLRGALIVKFMKVIKK